MKTLLALFILLALPTFAAAKDEPPPIYGQREKGSILISVFDHGCEKPGHYYISSNSLFAFIRTDLPQISKHVGDIKISRNEDGEILCYIQKKSDTTAEKDFELREGDIIWLVTPYI
jgi:hypothetical protein